MPSPKVDWSQFDVVAPAPKAAQPAAPEVDWSQFDVAQPEPAAPAVPPSADEFTAINDALSATPEPAKPRPLKGSVMEGVVPPEPTTTKIERTGAPITEETRAQLEAALSKMTPEQRDKVELRTDWIGSSVRAIRRQQRIADKQMNRNPVRTTGLPELGENRIAAEEQAARDRGPSLTKSDYDFESMKGAAGPRTGTGVLGDLTADVLSIGPTFAKSVAQITSMATGGTIGADSSAGFERGMKSFDALRSPQAIAQKRQNDLLMADPEADWLDVAKHLVKSPELLADMSISTVGSMGVPLGAAAVFAKGAAAATRASVISNAVMNAADTFESVKSGDLTDKYAGAAVSGLVSLLGGWLTEGGAEGEIARRMFQKSGAKTPEEFTSKLLQRAKVAGKEGVQEIIEEVGNVGGEVTGGNGFDVNTLMKRAAVSGIIGFAVGAAAGGGGHPTTTDTRPGSEIAQEMVDRTFGKTPAPTIPPAATTSEPPPAAPQATPQADTAPIPAEEVLGRVEPPAAEAPAATPSVPTEEPIASPEPAPAAPATETPAPEIDTSAMDAEGKAAVRVVKEARSLADDLDTIESAGIDIADWLGQGDVLGRSFDQDTVQTVQMLAEVARDPAKLAQLQKTIGDVNAQTTQGTQPAAETTRPAQVEGAGPAEARDGAERQPGAAQADQGSGVEDSGVKPQRELDHTERVEQARTQANTEPTEGQKDAGNYAKGHLWLHGMNLSIENPKGSTRRGTDKKGKAWESKLAHDYGYIRGTVGKDKDHLDVFIGPNHESTNVWVIDQKNPNTGVFDEHKIIMGATSEAEARAIYQANYPKGWKGIQSITATDVDGLKKWIDEGDTTKRYAPQSIADPLEREFTRLHRALADVVGKDRMKPITSRLRKATGDVNGKFTAEQLRKAVDEMKAIIREQGLGPVILQDAVILRRPANAPDKGINVEVAPNPDNTQLTERFNALSEREKRNVSQRVGDRIIPKVLADLGIDARIEHTVGGFEGATNPSILLHFDANTTFDQMAEAAKALGHVFSQKAVITFDEGDTKSGNQVGHVIVTADHDLSYEEQHDIFAAVTKAFPAAAGFTGNGGVMVFGNYTGFSDNPLTDEQFHQKLDEALAGLQSDFTSERRTWRSEYDDSQSLEGTRYGQGDTSSDRDAQGARAGRQRGDLNALREESDKALAEALEPRTLRQNRTRVVDTGIKLGTGERKTSVEDILNGNEKLPEKKLTVLEVGNYLQKRTLESSGLKERGGDKDESIARILAHDVLLALRKVGHGAGWYKGKIDNAIKVAGLVYPEIANDPQQRFMFTVALAITSNGQTIGKNVDMAFYMYDEFRRTGKFPTEFEMGGARRDQMRSSFAVVNDIVEQNDLDGTIHFLTSKVPASFLKKHMGFKNIAELMTEEVYGGTVLGSKVGGAFLQNLNGNFDALTMDRWFMRTWGRIVGKLTHTGTEREAEALRDFVEVMKARNLKGDPMEVAKQKYGDASKRSFENMTTVEKAARRLISASGMRDSPASGGDRSWMRKVVARALEMVNSQGHNLDVADLQAVLWYAEKEAYGKFGATDEEAEPTDYEQEVVKYAKQFGVDEKQIERALRGGQRGADADARAEQGTGAGREGTLRQNKSQGAPADQRGAAGSGTQSRAPDYPVPPVSEDTPTFNARPIQPDAVTLVGIHFGGTPNLTALDGDQFNQRGERSEESSYITKADGAIAKRVYFYAQLGNTMPRRELVLPARAVYRVKLTNLLDRSSPTFSAIVKDNLKAGRKTDHNGQPVFDEALANKAIERAIIAAGYDGYFVPPDHLDKRGGIVVLGVDKVPVEYVGTFSEAKTKLAFNRGLAEMDAPPAPGKYEEEGALSKYERAAWVLSQLGANSDFFTLPKTESKDLREIAKAMDERISVIPGVKSAPDMRAVWEIALPPTPDGKSGGFAMVRVYKDGRIEANFASLQEGRGSGAIAYQIVAEYARNNGLRFIGDPDGLSGLNNLNEKGVAHVRRAEQMISTFIKSQSTEHMEPHELQILDGFMDDKDALDVTKALKRWRKLDGLTKLAYAIRYAHGKITASIPAIADLRYDFERGYFYDIFDPGTALEPAVFDELAKDPAVRRAGGGSRTIRRAAIVNSVLSANDGAGWAARVAGVRALEDGVLPGALRRLAYDASIEAPRAGASSFPAADARRLVESVIKRWANGPKVVLHDNVDSANAAIAAKGYDISRPENRADANSHGFYDGDEVHIILNSFKTQRGVLTTLAHEAVGHYGLRAVLGETEHARVVAEITKLRKLGNKQIDALWQGVLETHGELSPAEMADEIIARAAEAAVDANGNVRPGFGWFKRVLAGVAQWLRAHGINVPFTYAELQGMLAQSARNLERGNRALDANGMAFNRAPVTETPEFKAWFKNSKVVDENGKPLRVYHGTKADFERFGTWPIYTTPDADAASQYAFNGWDPSDGSEPRERVLPLYLKIENPVVLDEAALSEIIGGVEDRDWSALENAADQWEKEGRDGIHLVNVADYAGGDSSATVKRRAYDQWIAFRPEQVRSAISGARFNRGPQGVTPKVGLLDAALRFPGKYVARYVTQPVASRVSSLADRITPESWKQGLIADYGLPEPYLDAKMDRAARTNQLLRNTKNLMQQLADLDRQQARVAYLWMTESPDLDAESRIMDQLPAESRATLVEMKQVVSDVGREAVALGLMDQETYDRNNLAYLHRSYTKHMSDMTKSEVAARKRSITIKGDQFKGRGLRHDMEIGDSEKGDKYIRYEKRDPPKPNERLGKLLAIEYIPIGNKVPKRLEGWRYDGVWEARFFDKPGQVGMWRDFTLEERQYMGEIDEVRFGFGTTMLKMVRDVENARFLRWVMTEYSKATEADVEAAGGTVVEGTDKRRAVQSFSDDEWVQVPSTGIPGTGLRKYHDLAGRYIPGAMFNDLRQIVNARDETGLMGAWDKMMRVWKINKTALSPAVHINNVMSNFIMADLADVRGRDLARAMLVLRKAAKGDEDAKRMIERFEDSGGDLGNFAHHELGQEIEKVLMKELEAEQNEVSDSVASVVRMAQVMDLMLHGRAREAISQMMMTKPMRALMWPFSKLISIYGQEDSVFRLAKFLKSLEEGESDRMAGKHARDAFLNYEINAPWINALRRVPFPFLAFSYRAIPMLLQAARDKPWKFAKYALVGGGLNALAYAMLGLGGDDEDKERKLIPEELEGRILGIFPRLIRMPWNDSHSNPVFLDARRWIPAGDVFETQPHSALPLPSWLTIGGPLTMVIESVANRSTFTGKDIVNDSDTKTEKIAKYLDYQMKFWSPNLPIPNPVGFAGEMIEGFPVGWLQTYSATNLMKAGKGVTDSFGREKDIAYEAANAVGVKVRPYAEDQLRKNLEYDLRHDLQEIDKTISDARRQYQRGGLDDAGLNKALKYQQDKKIDRLQKHREKLGL